MTNKEISQYIIDKKIPISFIWEDYEQYQILIWTGEYSVTTITNMWGDKFPNFKLNKETSAISIRHFNTYYNLLMIEKKTFEECLGEFLIWFELNKHRCKAIKYYKKTTQ